MPINSESVRKRIPKDFPVQPIAHDAPAKALATCGACGLSWDDGVATDWTPTPSARCPFEYYHTADKRKRSGISGNRAYKLKSRLVSRIADIYANAVHFKLTHDEISQKVREIMNDVDYKRLPTHAKEYIQGYWQAKRDEVYRYHITWVLSLDGNLLTSKEVDSITMLEKSLNLSVSPDYKSPWSRINGDLSRHVWKDANGAPLRDKSFDVRFR